MSFRVSFALAVVMLLLAAGLRMWDLSTLPSGFHPEEIKDIRITETVRQGTVEVFYLVGTEAREGLYHIALMAVTAFFGDGLIGFHIFSVFLGLLTLSLTYAVAMRLYGPMAGIAALTLLAVGMWPVLLSREVSREIALMFIISAVLLALVQSLPVSEVRFVRAPNTTPFATLGVMVGLSPYIHPVGLLVILFSVMFIGYMVLTRQPMSRRVFSYTGFAILVLIIISMPYLISSLRLPEQSGAARLFYEGGAIPQNIFSSITNSLGGFFLIGDANPLYNLPARPLIDLVSGLFVVVGLSFAVRSWRQPRFALPLIGLIVFAPVALLTGSSPSFLAYTPLLPLLALLFGLGVHMISANLERAVRPVFYTALIGLIGFNLLWTSRDLFENWPNDLDTQQAYNSRLGQIAHYLDITAGEIPTVVCAGSLTPTPNPFQLTNEQLLRLMMHREDEPIRYVDCGTGLVIANGGEAQRVILTVGDELQSAHPAVRQWLSQGEIADLSGLPAGTVVRLDVADELADRIGSFTTTSPSGYAPEAPGGVESVMLPVRFGGNLTFLGYQVENAGNRPYHPGDTVTSVTYWRADGVIPDDVRFFTHVLSDPAAISAQTDTISVLPGGLQPRDVLLQVTFIPLPYSIPQGVYNLSIGAYLSSIGERLPVFDGDSPRGTRLFLNQIDIAP